tara:strand:- start:4 stop:552 length:549 start_codon:yes stop_codon:yes gene_type:complete
MVTKTKKQKIFVEIGVCDFDTLEPLQRNGWKGYYVEPVLEYAKKLKGDITQCAISSYDGTIEFYISRSDGEQWVRGISHAVKQKGTKLLELENNSHLISRKITVPCYTLQSFLRMKDITHIDFLKVDTEGHETDIFDAYNWCVRPTMIKLEHYHIDDLHMKELLENQGYIVYREQRDIYAIR